LFAAGELVRDFVFFDKAGAEMKWKLWKFPLFFIRRQRRAGL
jgi:hypothetical protein